MCHVYTLCASWRWICSHKNRIKKMKILVVMMVGGAKYQCRCASN
uniref:Uncharacterized protein n=1 Tax=Rhizophora mucronata TaxID=61149 RepID=A0A2P2N4U8_RHIMU